MIELTFLLPYLIKASVCMLMFFFTYKLLHKQQTFFGVNRFYLNASLLASLTIPLIKLEQATLADVPAVVLRPGNAVSALQTTEATSSWSFFDIAVLIYLAVVAVSLGLLIYRLIKLGTVIARGKVQNIGRYQVVLTEGQYPTSSFFKYILWDNQSEKYTEEEIQSMIAHELVHVRLAHTLDNLFIELVKCFFWFNPVAHMYNSELKLVHEFQADQAVVSESQQYSMNDYQKLLSKQLLNNVGYQLTNNFNMGNLKQRLNMISKPKTNKLAHMKILLTIPLVSFMILFAQDSISAQEVATDETVSVQDKNSKTTTIVLEGTYQGKNIYFQNPFNTRGSGFTIQSIRINGKETGSDLNYSAFEVDLSEYTMGEKLKLEVTHATGSTPKVLNPEVIGAE